MASSRERGNLFGIAGGILGIGIGNWELGHRELGAGKWELEKMH